jgi:pimeloyl-ACP methyl ester carboxylesterase
MRAFTLAALRRRLEQAGYAVDQFDYASVFRSPEVSIEHLLRRAQSVNGRNLHFVGHSLGGLIAMQALQRQPGLTSGRVVCLGSPLRGSAVARGIAGVPGGAIIIGKEVGSISGRLPIGLGFAIGALSSPHDGTVSVAETELPGLTDHCVVPATHTGLLFSAEAAEQAIAFLRHGRFTRRE